MSFPKDFPGDAVTQMLGLNKDSDKALVALALYDILGFSLFQVFGDVEYPKTGLFDVLRAGNQGKDLYAKVEKRALELKGSGLGIALIILQLLAEFGPQILAFIQTIRDLLKKG